MHIKIRDVHFRTARPIGLLLLSMRINHLLPVRKPGCAYSSELALPSEYCNLPHRFSKRFCHKQMCSGFASQGFRWVFSIFRTKRFQNSAVTSLLFVHTKSVPYRKEDSNTSKLCNHAKPPFAHVCFQTK